MAQQLPSEPTRKERVAARRRYDNPPVHEVVIDLQFVRELNVEVLTAISGRLGSLGNLSPIQRVTQHTMLRPSGIAVHRPPEPSFWGWEFTSSVPRRVTTVSGNQLTQHFLRSENWPEGTYVGWEVQAESFRQMLELVQPLYSELGIKRAGIRYVNRVALPAETALREWFTVVPPPLPELEGLWGLTVSRTWERAKDFPGLSGTVTLAKTDVPADHGGSLGVILDIEIFNLYVKDAPAFAEVGQWIDQAHELENRIFESCITSKMAAMFDPLPENENA
jgi:uncharacterized protein (TIGR04255 family)